MRSGIEIRVARPEDGENIQVVYAHGAQHGHLI